MYGIICVKVCMGVVEIGINICFYMYRLFFEWCLRNSCDDVFRGGRLKGWEVEG